MISLARPRCLAVAFACLALPAAAEARPGEPVVRHHLAEGPVLAGGLAAWVEDQGTDQNFVRTGVRGVRARTVYRSEQGSIVVGLAGSRSALAFPVLDIAVPTIGPNPPFVYAGSRRGPFPAQGIQCASQGVALDRSRLLGLEQPSGCPVPQTGPTVAVIKSFAGAALRIPPSTQAQPPVAIAGRYLAFVDLTHSSVTVFDWVARRVAYRVAMPVNPRPGLDVQSDGKLVASRRVASGRYAVDWYSPTEPFAHRITTAAARRDVRIGRSLIGFVRRVRNGAQLVYARLSGRRTRVTSFPRRGRRRVALVGTFDFDGARMTWGARPRRASYAAKIRVVRAPAPRRR